MWQILDYKSNNCVTRFVKQAEKLENTFSLLTACLEQISVHMFWDILLLNQYFHLWKRILKFKIFIAFYCN
jgi:hypothetical protein